MGVGLDSFPPLTLDPSRPSGEAASYMKVNRDGLFEDKSVTIQSLLFIVFYHSRSQTTN